MRIGMWFNTNYYGADEHKEIEMDDDVTEDEINSICEQWAMEQCSWGWQKIDD